MSEQKKGIAVRVYSIDRERLLEAIEAIEEVAKDLRTQLEETDETATRK